MQISPATLNILKNFSSINRSIVINAGNEISTISPTKTIFGKARVPDTFPITFAIYDLNVFLLGLNLFKNPEFIFENNEYLIIKDGNYRVKYFFAEPELVVTSSVKNYTLPSNDVEFILESETLSNMIKAANVYQLPDLCVEGDGENIRVVVKDKKNNTSNSYSFIVGNTDSHFSYSFKMENVNLILVGKYKVSISSVLISHFKNCNSELEYFVPLEPEED